MLRHNVEFLPPRLSGVEAISLTSNRTFPRHAHDQFGIGVMVCGGHASWSGGGMVEAGPGDVIAVSPNELHDGKPITGGRSWKMLYVEPSTIAGTVGAEMAAREIQFAVRSAPCLASAILRVFDALSDGDLLAAQEGLTGLFADLLAPSKPIGDRVHSAATLRVLQRIHDQVDVPPPLDEVASLMGMGRTGALRRFRRETGSTPHEYATQIRLRRARRALASGESPASVAIGLGFADQSHMTRAFARQFGLPPGRYQSSTGNIVQDRGAKPDP